MKNRKGLTFSYCKKLKIKTNQSIYSKSGNLVNMKCIDKKEVFLLTNYDFDPENKTKNWKNNKIIKSYLISQYNKNKGSIDVSNEYTSYYTNEHRT